MAGLKAEGLYDLLQGPMAQPELSVSVGLPLPKRHKWFATATVSSPMAQESEALVPKLKGGVSLQGAPHLAIPQSKEEAIPAEMEPLQINVGDTKQVYHCHVEGCKEGPSTSRAAICSHVCQAHLGTKLSCPSCPHTFLILMPSDAMASGCIPLGPQTPFRVCIYYCVMSIKVFINMSCK